MFNSPISHTVY